MRGRDIDRFNSHVQQDENGCLIWVGANTGHPTYPRPQFVYPTRTQTVNAARWIWAYTYGPIPEGLVLRHKCDVTLCVSLDHLELGTARDNTQDCLSRGRNYSLNKTHCKNGHEFTKENTHFAPATAKRGPRRHCRRCSADCSLRRYNRNRK